MKRVVQFYIVAFVYSWSIWGLGILFLDNIDPILLVSFGGAGPLVGVIYYLIQKDTPTFKTFFKNRFFPKHSLRWLVMMIAFLIPLVVLFLSYFIDGLLNMKLSIALDQSYLSSWLVSMIFLFFFGPLPEEIAWRGLAFHKLAKKDILSAQLIVMVLWALWHLPLFFIEGSYQAGLGLLTLDGGLFFLNILFLSILSGWIYLFSSSILTAVVFHFMVNFLGEFFILTSKQSLIQTIIYLLISFASIIIFLKRRNQLSF